MFRLLIWIILLNKHFRIYELITSSSTPTANELINELCVHVAKRRRRWKKPLTLNYCFGTKSNRVIGAEIRQTCLLSNNVDLSVCTRNRMYIICIAHVGRGGLLRQIQKERIHKSYLSICLMDFGTYILFIGISMPHSTQVLSNFKFIAEEPIEEVERNLSCQRNLKSIFCNRPSAAEHSDYLRIDYASVIYPMNV